MKLTVDSSYPFFISLIILLMVLELIKPSIVKAAQIVFIFRNTLSSEIDVINLLIQDGIPGNVK